ncbi:MAG: hypothetical protein IJ968_09710 [Clostridia bacterium]|nr:hypothetical protein [Clostridia bacterium]
MANQMISIKELARLTLPRLMDNLVFPQLCYRDLEQDITGRKLGDTIQIRQLLQYKG